MKKKAKSTKNAKKDIKDEIQEVIESQQDNKETVEEIVEDTKEEKIEELTNDLKRVQADFENYKKRCEKENDSFKIFAKAGLIKKLLSILDSFEMALKNTNNQEEFIKGMELIYSQFFSVLRDEGLEPITTKDKKFDPYLHEVMLTEKSDQPEESIIEELQKGYKLKGEVLRHSKVKIAKK